MRNGSHHFDADEAARHEAFALALFRLFKLATIHDLENQAVKRGIEFGHQTLIDIFAHETHDLSALFAGENIFINGQPLRASRATYESLQELGNLLEKIGLNEVRVGRRVGARSLDKMLSSFASARARGLATRRVQVDEHVRMQYVDPSFLLGGQEDELDLHEQIARTYTSAIVVMRRVYQALEAGEPRLVSTTKRVAQSLVMLVERDAIAMLDVLESGTSSRDHATLGVQAAILTAVMARTLTRDLRMLTDMTISALLFEAARSRLRAAQSADDVFGPGLTVELTTSEEDAAPGSSVVSNATMFGMHQRATKRILIGYEAQWIARSQRLGPVYRGKLAPGLESIIVSTAWRFQELIAFDISREHMRTADEALQALIDESSTKAEKLILKLLCSALGIFPRGTLLELSSGWRGVVSQNHNKPSLYNKPQLLLAISPRGPVQPRFIDLAELSTHSLALGEISGTCQDPTRHLVDTQRALLTGAITPPALEDPTGVLELDARSVPEEAPTEDELQHLSQHGRRRARMADLVRSSEETLRTLSDDDQDDELFSHHD